MSGSRRDDLAGDLLATIPRASLVREVARQLGISQSKARQVVKAFDDFVAQPLERNLKKFGGKDLAKRNPMVYTLRGIRTVEDWVDRSLEDRETSAIEGHLGTFLEEVARIVSGGSKPGSGVDLQIDSPDGVVELYAIQAAPNTKNSGSRGADVAALKRAARPLRAARRHVDLKIAVLSGRPSTAPLRSEPGIDVVGSDDFWFRVSGVRDFRARLLEVSLTLSNLMRDRATDETRRIKEEAMELFGDDEGNIELESVARLPIGVSGARATGSIQE